MAEYIKQNAGLNEAQAGIKISRRNINNFRYADDTTLMAESEEELKSLLMKLKEESEKVGLKLTRYPFIELFHLSNLLQMLNNLRMDNIEFLKLNIQKTKITASGPITS